MGLLGILVALGLLIWLAYRGWSVLLLAPAAAILAAGLAGEPLLAHWTQTFMGSAARFIMQFFPIFLLGALFGKLMEDSGSVSAIASSLRFEEIKIFVEAAPRAFSLDRLAATWGVFHPQEAAEDFLALTGRTANNFGGSLTEQGFCEGQNKYC